MALGRRSAAAVLAAVVLAVVGGVVWQSVAGSESGPVRNPPPPNPLDKEPDPVLREALRLPWEREAYRGRLDCDLSDVRYSPFIGPIALHVPPKPPSPGGVVPPTYPIPPRRYLPGWHEVARSPEEAAENLTLSEQFERAGTVGGQIVYAVGERSDAAGLANLYGALPDGRRVRITRIERHEDGSWEPPHMHLGVSGKSRADFATDEEFATYDAFDDPDAIWSWGSATGGAYCDGLRDPVPGSVP